MDVAVVSRVVYPMHGFGGMEKHVYQLVTRLAKEGHKVEIFCMETDEDVPTELQHENIAFTFVPYREFSFGRLSYLSFIKNLFTYFPNLNEKDVVHFQGMTGGVPYAFRGKRPTVYTTHGLEQFKHSLKWLLWPFNIMEVLAAQKASQIVSLGPGNTEEIKTFLRVGDEKITEIPNGVDIDFFEPKDARQLNEKYGLKENVIVAVSRLVEYKGHGLLVEAVNDMENTSLVIAGDGPFREELEEKGGDEVYFAGRVDEDELPYYYSLGDIFCLPTFGEGMPLSILESYACGTPVLSTNTGSIPDIVDENTGLLVEPRSTEALKNGIETLFSQNLEKMGEVCRSIAVEDYSWDKTVERTVRLYERLLEG